MLVRFFRNEDFAKLFMQGKVFCNSLDFFQTYITDEKTARLATEKCTDIYEGSAQILHDFFPFSEFVNSLDSDPNIVFSEYAKSHICCFSQVSNSSCPENMEEFGSYAVAIYDFDKFKKKIKAAVLKYTGLYYLYGAIDYYAPTINRKKVTKNIKHQILMSLEGYRIRYDKNSEAFIYRDAFCKINRFSNQNEWRLFFYKENWNTLPFIFEMGNLEDCCLLIPASKRNFIEVLNRYPQGNNVSQRIKGNIDRVHLNEMITGKDPWGKLHFSLSEPTKEGISKIIEKIPPVYIRKEPVESERMVIRLLL